VTKSKHEKQSSSSLERIIFTALLRLRFMQKTSDSGISLSVSINKFIFTWRYDFFSKSLTHLKRVLLTKRKLKVCRQRKKREKMPRSNVKIFSYIQAQVRKKGELSIDYSPLQVSKECIIILKWCHTCTKNQLPN
jgi:hypothetical protein